MEESNMYGFSPVKKSSTVVMFLIADCKEMQKRTPVSRRKITMIITDTISSILLGLNVPGVISNTSSKRGPVIPSRKQIQLLQDHQFKSKKYLWFRQPTQDPIQGQ